VCAEPAPRTVSVILAFHVVRSPDPTGLLPWCVLGFVAGIGLFVYGFRLLQRRRLILDTPFSKIRSASLGMVEVSGLAVGPYAMIAPITARPCYYYRTLVWEYKQEGKNKKWVKVAGECMHVPFFIDDNTGRLLVDPRGADLDLHCDFKEEFNGSFFSNRDAAPGNVTSFLSGHGVATINRIKVEEYCIKPKNCLFILGTLAENPGIEVGPQPVVDTESTDSFSSQRFSLSMSLNAFLFSTKTSEEDFSSPAQPLAPPSDAAPPHLAHSYSKYGPAKTSAAPQPKVAGALLKAGISNPAAWAAAGVASAGVASGVQVIENSSAASPNGSRVPSSDQPNFTLQAVGFDPHPPVALMQGTNDHTFLISWRSQQDVARSLGWKCALLIWGGPALALLSLYFFVSIERLF
jgi:hypothetical protein